MAFLQGLVDGVLIGGVYAVVAVGLTLLFGVVGIVNFAHGAIVMAGGYLTYQLYDSAGVDPYLSAVILAVLFFVVGVLFYAAFFRRLVKESLLPQALFTIGVSIVLINVALAVYGPDVQSIDLPYSLSTVNIGEISMEVTRLVAFGAALLTTLLLYLLLWRTDFGIQVRASAADRQTAELMGIRTLRVQSVATGLSFACAAIGGAVLMPILFVSPATGDQFTFLAFVIIVLGGLGSFFGALVGGIIIGIAQSLGATYVDGSTAQMLTFALFIVLLLFKPNGLFTRGERRPNGALSRLLRMFSRGGSARTAKARV